MNKEKNYHIGRAIGTLASMIICSYLLYLTNGEHGIGWFVLSLLIIWGA